MASQQMRRENVASERDIEVEKDRVPKMTTHFESLAVKANEHDSPHHGETVPVKVMGMEFSEGEKKGSQISTGTGKGETERKAGEEFGHGQKEMGGEKETRGRGGGEESQEKPSLEEISNLRAQAQQNSMEAIRAAEERYEKAKETVPSEGTEGRDVISSKGGAMEKGQTGAQYAAEEGGAIMEKGQQAKDYAAQMATESKDVISSKGQSAAEYAAEKARAAKDTLADTTITAAGYVQDKAVAAKDVAAESGKGAAGYAGKVASGVKDLAVVAGWGTTHYTLEKVVEATKAMAGVTSSVAGYTGDKAVAAKDKLAEAGHTVAGYAGEKIAQAKDKVVATEEKAAEYAARKQEEAKRELEAKRASHQVEGGQQTLPGKQKQHETKEQLEAPFQKDESFQGGGSESGQEHQREEGPEYEQKTHRQSGGGGVLQAIGETIVEIGQTTKDLLVGQSQYPSQVKDEQHRDVEEEEEPYREAGEGI